MSERAPDHSGAITGRVHSSDGWPIADAIVTVTDMHGRQAARTIVGADGAFTAAGLSPSAYTVVVSTAGQQPLARTASVRPGQATALGVLTTARTGGSELPPRGVWTIDPIHSSVRATALHLGITKIHGRFTDFGGRIVVADPPEQSSVEVSIQAVSIATHNEDRDAHLRSSDFLYTERFPAITYRSETVERRGDDTWAMTGPLVMRDVSRPVRLDVRYLGAGPDLWGGTRAGFTATAELARDDFAMIWNQSMPTGISAFARTLEVDIDIQAVLG